MDATDQAIADAVDNNVAVVMVIVVVVAAQYTLNTI